MENIILGLALLFFVGHFLQWVFVKTKVPDLLILIVGGFLLGPSGFSFISHEDIGKVGNVLATVTLIIIIYEGGLNLNAKSLFKSSLPALMLSILSFVLITVASVVILFPIAGLETGLLIGLGIGSTSSAVVFPMIKPLNLKQDTKTLLSLESAFTDVLAIMCFLVVLESIVSKNYEASSLFFGFSAGPLLSIGFGMGSALAWAFLRKLFKQVFSMSFSTEAWTLLTYGLIEMADLNGVIGILAFGFTLSNLELIPYPFRFFFNTKAVTEMEMSLLQEISFLLKTFFFIYLGMLLKIAGIGVFIVAGLLCFLIYFTRYVSVRTVMKPRKFPYADALISVGMGPRGLACAVLSTLPMQRGFSGGEFIQNVIFYVILISIVLTSLCVIFGQKTWFQSLFAPFFEPYVKKEKSQDLL